MKTVNGNFNQIIAVLLILLSLPAYSQDCDVDEGNDEKSSRFLHAFGFHEPMYFALGEGKKDGEGENLTYAQFQISFRFEIFDFYLNKRPLGSPLRGLNISYTQRSFWDLESRSQPFYDNSFMPAVFILWQYLGGKNIKFFDRIDIEGGYQHHSNGRDGKESRFIDLLYIKPTFVWKVFKNDHIFFAPKAWVYLGKETYNKDIADYWGYVDLELTYRANFGLQLETHVIPAKNITTFHGIITYPVSKLWKPLKFYIYLDYWNGAGETILRYDLQVSGILLGIALSR